MGYTPQIISEIKDGRINFENNTFDLVLCNQVFEHIGDIDSVLLEINRVLKPNGYMFCIFPPKDVFIEWHVGIPFIHWLPKRSTFRYLLTLFFRTLGFGFNKEKSSRIKWTLDKLWYLEEFTFYRSVKNVISTFSKFFNVNILKLNSFNTKFELRGISGKVYQILRIRLLLNIFTLFQNHWNLIIIASKKGL